jgi:hypothetical protein
MAFVVFLLGLILLLAGFAGGFMSLDLIPTSPGLLYAFAGAVAVAMAIVAFALGVLIRRIDALIEMAREAGAPAAVAETQYELAPVEPAFAEETPLAPAEAEALSEQAAPAEAEEEPINENRAGHLPTLGEIEHALETPEFPPSLVGRYSSGGANYMIFSDGSIEAETAGGMFKFASMGDFKRFLADRQEGRG